MVSIEYVDKETWKEISENSHMAVFGEERKNDVDRIDYALLGFTGDKILGYVTCTEFDSKNVYWNYGGVPEPLQGRHEVFQLWKKFLNYAKDMGYVSIFMHIRNDNKRMLKLAAHTGFIIKGLRINDTCTLLEHVLELSKLNGNDRGHG